MPFDGGGIKQVGSIAEATLDGVANLAEDEFEIELYPIDSSRHHLDLQIRQIKRAPVRALPGKQNLEEWSVLELAGRIDPLDDLLEGDILMILCSQGDRAHAVKQRGDGGVPDKSMRKARVLTKKPIKGSISCLLRFAESVPITTSS